MGEAGKEKTLSELRGVCSWHYEHSEDSTLSLDLSVVTEKGENNQSDKLEMEKIPPFILYH